MTGPRRWTTWALVASLSLNLLALGLIGGALLKGGRPPPEGGTLWGYARSMPEPYRRDLGRALRDSRHDWDGPRDALRGQRAAFAATLTAAPFDPDAVTSVLKQQTALTDELAQRATDLLVAQIARMTPEERATYASDVQEDRRRHGRRRDDTN